MNLLSWIDMVMNNKKWMNWIGCVLLIIIFLSVYLWARWGWKKEIERNNMCELYKKIGKSTMTHNMLKGAE